MPNINKFKLGVSILLPLLAGAVGSFFTMPAVNSWYKEIAKPPFNPPNWIFGPVWTLLYILMGIALYLVWQSGVGAKKKKIAVSVFTAQLALNILWSVIFFGLKNFNFSFVELVALWGLILINLVLFSKIKKIAGWLLLPYLFWASFAAVLNFFIWQLNY
ncbi:MAG: tryptophan-rich sensory protein [Candidatus Azambacteria bacterium]|nr:tryptophan-rich sensory protein [Candidatus Azambacteria bacterium]